MLKLLAAFVDPFVAAVADVVADVYQTPIFAVAAVADINLRRISQLNKNVCYGCYTKNGRLLQRLLQRLLPLMPTIIFSFAD